jgi:DNA polymerase-3 subunit alpha
VKVLAPDINRSEAFFACDADKGMIFYALAAVKGVGRQAMDHVVAERHSNGPFTSLADFAQRIDPRLVNKRAFESLARAGAFDALNRNRRQMVESSDILLGSAARTALERETGQATLFGGVAEAQQELRLAPVADWPAHERLSEEFAAMGFYLSGHPLDAYAAALRRLGATTYASLLEDRRRSSFKAVLAGTLIRKHERRARSDQMYAFASFSDPTGMFEVMLFPEVLAASRPLLEAGKSILVTASAEWDGDELKLRASSLLDLDAAAANAGEGLRVHLQDGNSLGAIAAQLKQPGKGIVTFVVPGTAGEEVEIALPKRLQVTSALKNAIKSLPGVAAVESV